MITLRVASFAAAAALMFSCTEASSPAPQSAVVIGSGGGISGDGTSGNPLRLDLATASSQCSSAADVGRLRFDGTGGRLQFCDGTSMVDVGTCSPGGGCSSAEYVACGTPVLDACGNPCGSLIGTACAGGSACLGGSCVPQPPRSCLEIVTANGSAPSTDYTIDPDGPGGHAPVQVYCDMPAGYTLVLNVYDTTGDDAPNTADWVAAGWEQGTSGGFVSPVTRVSKAYGPGASSAMPPSLVRALWRDGQSQLKFCLVGVNDTTELCKATDGGSLTLAAAPVSSAAFTNRTLASFMRGSMGCPSNSACDAAYTYGRLAGLPASRNDYVESGFVVGSFCILRTVGLTNEFGTDATGICEYSSAAEWVGVWHNWGSGMSYRPWRTNDNELGNANGANPVGTSLTATGFRVWVK
jgi:hypothetical protein